MKISFDTLNKMMDSRCIQAVEKNSKLYLEEKHCHHCLNLCLDNISNDGFYSDFLESH